MDLKSNDEICGLTAKTVRDAFTKIGTGVFSKNGFERSVIRPKNQASLISDFLGSGFIEHVKEREGAYRLSQAGLQLSKTNFLKRMDRKKIDALMSGVLSRANLLDEDLSDNPYQLRTIDVFGSYLLDKDSYGDLDLVVVLEAKPEIDREDLVRLNTRYTDMHGPKSLSFFDGLFFAQTHILRYLKNRSPRIDFTPSGDLETLAVKSVRVWERDGVGHLVKQS